MPTFKQINPFIARVSDQKHIRHLLWMKRFDSRVSACITELGDETPAKLSQSYTTLHAAVEHEDQVFLVIQESSLTATIEEWDQKRDNTYVGIRTMVDGEFVGSLHGLVEVAAKPAEVLLELQIEVCHLVQSIDLTDCCSVIELLYGIPDHCADGRITGCFPLEQGFFFGREPNPKSFRFLFHWAVIL